MIHVLQREEMQTCQTSCLQGVWNILRYLQVKKALTMTEKILAKHSNNTTVVPGQNIWTNVDKLMTHDVCGPGTFGIFQREFGENAQVCGCNLL